MVDWLIIDGDFQVKHGVYSVFIINQQLPFTPFIAVASSRQLRFALRST
jgi:hypothetical protein